VIEIYLSYNGYHIKGNGVDAALSCSPKLDENGETFYSEYVQVYVVLAKALNELRNRQLSEDITVYNDSRLIDEMNGVVPTIDDLSLEFRDRIRREIMPTIGANIFFRKKSTKIIRQHIALAQDTMISVPNKKQQLQSLQEQHVTEQRDKSLKALDKLKENWKNGRTHKQ